MPTFPKVSIHLVKVVNAHVLIAQVPSQLSEKPSLTSWNGRNKGLFMNTKMRLRKRA